MGSDPTGVLVVGLDEPFQSTLPHGERRHPRRHRWWMSRISIHAPAWGATDTVVDHADAGRISIHAPAWGATITLDKDGQALEFQSTLPHGERPAHVGAAGDGDLFQSTLPHGERLKVSRRRPISPRFQSTLPHGERHDDDSVLLGSEYDFNPRSRMGSDQLDLVLGVRVLISIHAPAWGATVGRTA